MENMPLREAVKATRLYREKLLADPCRPGYHFAIPDGIGEPGDPNGAFYANGRYHLMYLYNRGEPACWGGACFCWGHISSADLVHWRHHPDAITPGDGDGGCFSGGAFVEGDTAYLTFWALPSSGQNNDGGINIAVSRDRYFEKWEKMTPVAIPCSEFGITESHGGSGCGGNNGDGNNGCGNSDGGSGCGGNNGDGNSGGGSGAVTLAGNADPSNIWKKGGVYYMQAGNKVLMDKLGGGDDACDDYKGDWVDLYSSNNLKNWEYVHRFYQRKKDNSWTAESEDDMCPSFLPLPARKNGGKESGKYLQLFISHNKGCQYYIGTYDEAGDLFLPEIHGRMTWIDNAFFAPEALVDHKGRQIMWAWLIDNPIIKEGSFDEPGWSGVYSLPRELWLGGDGTLRMAPAGELAMLRYNARDYGRIELRPDKPFELDGINPDSCELCLALKPGGGDITEVGFKLYAGCADATDSADEEYALIYCDLKAGCVVFDASKSGNNERAGLQPFVEKAPFALGRDEELELRVFIDKSVVEVFACERQAITRRVYHAGGCCKRIAAYCGGKDAPPQQAELKAWEMMQSNMY